MTSKEQRKLRLVKAIDLIEQASVAIEYEADDLRERWELLSATVQESERGQALDEAATALEEACGALHEVADTCRDL